jgi:hypothetical protein
VGDRAGITHHTTAPPREEAETAAIQQGTFWALE